VSASFSETAAFIWAVADLLRGDFKQSQYGRIILPFTLLRRLECVLAPTRDKGIRRGRKGLCAAGGGPREDPAEGCRAYLL
jgi:type I restriction enzyme M protein